MSFDIPEQVRARMVELEELDRRDRIDGTEHQRRLRQVPPDTGKFLALMALFSPDGPMLELGTSAGYSALWLSLACRRLGRKLVTCEILPEKARLARETFEKTNVDDVVDLQMGDGLQVLQEFERLAFCFWDSDKDRAVAYYQGAVDRLVPGGIFAADNAISHELEMAEMLAMAQSDPKVDAIVVPIGKGVLIARRSVDG